MHPMFAFATVHQGLQGYFVGWGTLSLINAGLAQSKGQSGFVWWLASLLLGPIATFIIVALIHPPPAPLPTPAQSKPAADPPEV